LCEKYRTNKKENFSSHVVSLKIESEMKLFVESENCVEVAKFLHSSDNEGKIADSKNAFE
jgi:hypothetical protein